ncbi:MAG: alpha/beta hydrolase [Verrucomicrobiota bacterium]
MIYAGYQTTKEIDYQLTQGMTGQNRDEAYANFIEGAYRARDQFSCKLDLMYGSDDRQRIDFFKSAGKPEVDPTIVFFHGGGWRLSDKFFANFWAEAFCPAGYNFIAASYGFLPLYSLDKIIDHARLAVSWIHAENELLGIDPTRLIIGGNSAGAHLAMMAILNDWDETELDPTHLLGVFGFSGLYDLETAHHSKISGKYITSKKDARAWSPYLRVRENLPPAFIAYGEEETDEFARQSAVINEAWTAAGNKCELHSAPQGNHFNTQWFARTPGDPLHESFMAFLSYATSHP